MSSLSKAPVVDGSETIFVNIMPTPSITANKMPPMAADLPAAFNPPDRTQRTEVSTTARVQQLTPLRAGNTWPSHMHCDCRDMAGTTATRLTRLAQLTDLLPQGRRP
jgi:hypothetical protein